MSLVRGGLLGLLFLTTLLPLGVLAISSVGVGWFWPNVLPPRWTLDAWRELLSGTGRGRLAEATLTSFWIASGTGLLAVGVGFPVAQAMARLKGVWRAVAAGAAFLPVAAPPLALGVGLQVIFLSLGLGGSKLGVVLAHLVPAAGYVSLFLLGVLTVRGTALETEARSLGASPLQTLRHVTLPTLRRPLFEGMALGFLVSWAQLPLTLLVGQGVVGTLPLEVFSLVQSGQDPRAAVGSILLITPPLLLLAVGARLKSGRRPVVVA